jgi:PAS domain S-box-containing protein
MAKTAKKFNFNLPISVQKEKDVLQIMIDSAENMHLVYLDRDFNFVKVNRAYAETCGYKPEEMVGKNHFALYPDRENEAIFRRVRDTGVVVQFKNKPFTFPDQPERGVTYWDWTLTPVKDNLCKVTGLVFSLVETTERKKAEKEISDLAKFPLEDPFAVLRVNREGILMFANPASYKFLEEWHCRVGDRIPGHICRMIIGSLTSNERIEFEERIGEETFSFLIAPIVGEDYVNLYGRSITKRKKAEEALKESEQLYRTIFDNRDDGFVLVDPIYDENNNACDIRFLQLNLACEQQTGTKAAKVEGKRAKEVAPNIEQEWISLCGVVAKTGKTRRIESFNARTNKWYDANYIPFSRGRVGILFKDVTERKNLERQLQDSERLAAIGATAGMVGHDIRNPLQAMISDVYLAKADLASIPDGSAKQGVKESLEGIEKNVFYINKIVSDLQDYARPLTPSARETDLEMVFNDVLVKKAIPENIVVSRRVEPKARILIADPDILKRILVNLVNNAVQAMPQGGKLAIHATKKSEEVIITVGDTGIGIPEEVHDKLFTPMFTTKSKGQGFGLVAVKRLTEALGGTVSFESKVGKGTKFKIELPANSIANR